MKILEQESKKTLNGMRTDYLFEKLNTLDDVVTIAKSFEACGIKITNILVSELGDYEDGPLNLGYPNVEALKKSIAEDFDDKIIEDYLINGEYKDTLLSALICPQINKMIVRYKPKIQEELKTMFETKINSNVDDSKINSIQHL